MLEAELSALDDKFELWAQDARRERKPPVTSVPNSSQQQTRRVGSVNCRLYTPVTSSSTADRDNELLEEHSRDIESEELIAIRVEMDALEKQIDAIGGPNCGWDAADHKDFLRVRTRHGGRLVIAFAQEL